MSECDWRSYAQGYEHECCNEVAGDFTWSYASDFPLSQLEDSDFDLREWMRAEIAMWRDEGQPERFAEYHLADDVPIVVHLDDDGRGRIWDGWHRSGARALKGMSTIPAVVGERQAT
jgi:hypothetical protein